MNPAQQMESRTPSFGPGTANGIPPPPPKPPSEPSTTAVAPASAPEPATPRVTGGINAPTGSAAAEGIAMLKTGCVALKYGRQGKPHPATFKLSDDETVLSWEDGRGGLTSTFSNLAGKMANKRRSVRISCVAELLVGAESNVFRRCTDTDDGDGSLCLSLLIDAEPPAAPTSKAVASLGALASSFGAGSHPLVAGEKDSLDVRVTDELTFARWVAALHALLAASAEAAAGGVAAEEARRTAALARSAPALHEELIRREAAMEAELRAQAEKEAARWMGELQKHADTQQAAEGDGSHGGGEMGGSQGGSSSQGSDGRPLARELAARDESTWTVGEMKAALREASVSLDGVTEKDELRRLTRCVNAHVHGMCPRSRPYTKGGRGRGDSRVYVGLPVGVRAG